MAQDGGKEIMLVAGVNSTAAARPNTASGASRCDSGCEGGHERRAYWLPFASFDAEALGLAPSASRSLMIDSPISSQTLA